MIDRDNHPREPSGETPDAPDPNGFLNSEWDIAALPKDGTPYAPGVKPLWNNVISLFGMWVATIGLVLLLTFGLFSLVSPTRNPYVDIVGFMVLPGILITGLVIVPIGITFKSWRLRRKDPGQRLVFRFPRIDLNDPVQRRAAKFFLAATFVMLPIVGVSGYHGYHYTDSSEFCAKVCHEVMEPEAATYEFSAHARVSCAECHIGTGASWFVKSKLSGTRQVLAVMRDSFSRPIPPAITELRPARETCERCHWPKKFFGAQLKKFTHFASDENNTEREIRMLLKTGGGDEATGRAEGIHLHMALEGRIEYVATDEKLQEIPWVRYTDRAGDEVIYRSDGKPSSDPRPGGQLRGLDCMDCHNRPAHKFRSPQQMIDDYLEVGTIDGTLPFVKREAIKALVQEYPNVEVARAKIGQHLMDFYQNEYPELTESRKASIHQAIDGVRRAYEYSVFPGMKVNWKTYPDNIGHMISPGCFRCHDGSHMNQRGERLSHRCDICHTFLNPVSLAGRAEALQEGDFVHPLRLEGAHVDLSCHQCHTGGISPDPSCAGCHAPVADFRAGKLAGFEDVEISPDAMWGSVECQDCHDLSEPTSVEAIDALCLDCHDDEAERFEGMLAGWKIEVDQALSEAATHSDSRRRALAEALTRVGPMHNIEATRALLRAEINSD